MSGLFAAGLILLALAAVADFTGGRFMRSGPLYLLGAAGSACLATLGGFALAGRPVELDVAGWLGNPVPGQQAAALAADRLSGMFLALTFGAAVPVSVAFASWAVLARGDDPPEPPAHGGPARLRPRLRRGLGASYALALGAVAVIMTAQDAFTLLFGWETLTLAFYLLAGSERNKPGRSAAAQVTFAFGKVSGAALLVGLLLLATRSHSIMLTSFTHVPGGAARTTAEVLLLGGFAVKAGLVPFQVWLPRGYSAAPGPARAIMAGVCVNVAFYGMWRTLALVGRAPGWLTGTLLVLGALSALLGIAHAAVQNRLSRVIAYSSIENTGLIVTGFGVALTGAATGDRRLVAAGLLAATLQVVAHTVAKSLLFTSSAGIEAATGRDDLEELRGSAGGRGGGRSTPWSRFGLAVGSLTLGRAAAHGGFRVRVVPAGIADAAVPRARPRLPPGAGPRRRRGRPHRRLRRGHLRPPRRPHLSRGERSPRDPPAHGGAARGAESTAVRGEYGWAGRAAIVVLAFCCLATAAVTPLEIRVIAAGLSPAVPASLTMGALKSPWILQPVFAGFSILSPSWLWVEMPLMLLLVGLFAWAVSGRRLLRVRRVPAWRSATIGVEGADSYTAFGYANPTRRVLAGVLHTHAELRQVMMEEDASDDGSGAPDRADPGGGEEDAHLRYASDVVEVVETYLYRPALGFFMAIVTIAKRLQSGRLDAYLLYMLIALIAIIAVVTALA